MKEPIKLIAAGLREAYLAEVEGEHFYRMAAASTHDPKGKEVFAQLADEERQHQDYLKQQHDTLLKTGTLDETLPLGKPRVLEEASPIFTDALRGRIAEAHFEMTSLAVGIQLELSAERFYKDASAAAELPLLRRFYSELAAWEAAHYHALLRQQELLREDYWQASGFTPF